MLQRLLPLFMAAALFPSMYTATGIAPTVSAAIYGRCFVPIYSMSTAAGIATTASAALYGCCSVPSTSFLARCGPRLQLL